MSSEGEALPSTARRLNKMARRPGGLALLAFAAAPWLLAGFAPVPPLNRHASARRRNVQINVETESRTEQPTKRRRRNGVRRRNNGEQRNGEPQPVNGKSEGVGLRTINGAKKSALISLDRDSLVDLQSALAEILEGYDA